MTYKEFELKLNQLAKDLDAKYPNRGKLEREVLEKLKDYYTDVVSKFKEYEDRFEDSSLMYAMKVDIDQKAEAVFHSLDSAPTEFVYRHLGDKAMLDIVKPLLDGAAYALADLSERLDEASKKIVDLSSQLAKKVEQPVTQDKVPSETEGDAKA